MPVYFTVSCARLQAVSTQHTIVNQPHTAWDDTCSAHTGHSIREGQPTAAQSTPRHDGALATHARSVPYVRVRPAVDCPNKHHHHPPTRRRAHLLCAAVRWFLCGCVLRPRRAWCSRKGKCWGCKRARHKKCLKNKANRLTGGHPFIRTHPSIRIIAI